MSKVDCITISVDCCHNDPVDIRCGGCEYHGFDFYVKRHEEKEMIDFIIKSLKELEMPLMNIGLGDLLTLEEKDVWTKERILASLVDNAEFIIGEAERYYNRDLKPRM